MAKKRNVQYAGRDMKADSHWTDEYREMIDDCAARESRMTEWECSFVESLDEQLFDTKSLSTKQIDVLNRIWEKVTARG